MARPWSPLWRAFPLVYAFLPMTSTMTSPDDKRDMVSVHA